jgi:hypothetical protein
MAPDVQLQKVFMVEPPACPDVDIIFLYGVTGQDTFDGTRRWSSVLPSLAPSNSNILGCDMKLRLLDQSGWKDLPSKGGDLLEAIYEYHLASKDNPRPIIFICYSLAGWVLKQVRQISHFALYSTSLTETSDVMESSSTVQSLPRPD